MHLRSDEEKRLGFWCSLDLVLRPVSSDQMIGRVVIRQCGILNLAYIRYRDWISRLQRVRIR